MDIRHLMTFLWVAKLGSFTKAAEKLGYVQSSISAQIGALERELGVNLFQRISGKNVTLTVDGERLLPVAEEIVTLSEKAKGTIRPQQDTVHIATIESISNSRLKGLFHAFHMEYPHINLIIHYGSCAENLSLLQKEDVEIAILLDHKTTSPELDVQIICSEKLSLLVTHQHELFNQEFVSPVHLNGMDIILTEQGCSYREMFVNLIHAERIIPQRFVEINSITAIVDMIKAGRGIALLPEVAVQGELASKELVPLNWTGPSFDMFTQVVWKKGRVRSTAAKTFLAMSRGWSVP